LILPESISKITISRITRELNKKSISTSRLRIYIVKEDLDLYLAICDETMSLGLFKNDGSFDQNRILTSSNRESKKWAEELFEYVKGQVME
jgi:predicted transcriptional regulator